LTEPVCQIEGLKKTFKKQDVEIPIIRNVDLTINSGDMCSIQGKSGVGKSTLLHILGALDRPTAGTVKYSGSDIFELAENDLATFRNQSIGFVFQFHHLLPEFTAHENVAMPALIAGKPRAVALKSARDLLVEVGLESRLTHRPGELSGGEQQRVAIARALVMQPTLVLADEPTGNLDEKTSSEIHDLLLSINKRSNVAFLVVTHNPILAAKMNRMLEMRDGVVYEGVA